MAVVPSLIREDKLVPDELSSNNNLVKLKVVLEVFGHAEFKSGHCFGLSLFLEWQEIILPPT